MIAKYATPCSSSGNLASVASGVLIAFRLIGRADSFLRLIGEGEAFGAPPRGRYTWRHA